LTALNCYFPKQKTGPSKPFDLLPFKLRVKKHTVNNYFSFEAKPASRAKELKKGTVNNYFCVEAERMAELQVEHLLSTKCKQTFVFTVQPCTYTKVCRVQTEVLITLICTRLFLNIKGI
jgi:hypothetical protein